MCGIAGLIIKKGQAEHLPERINTMTKLIQHRGPDGEGFYIDNNLAFGHRRLAIIDLTEDGHQPMYHSQGQLVITYNGEIYNYLEIKKELQQLGHHFHSKSDTEVILAAYSQWGPDCVSRFNGMWAFAIHDKIKNRVFCSRDRFGVKPFYYFNNQDLFAFGSEIRQLLPLKNSIRANQDVLLDFILTSITDHSQDTFFQDIVKLPAGHNLIYCLDNNSFTLERFYELNIDLGFSSLSANDAVESYMELLEDSIRLRLRADVQVGTCLSGGLDSSTVASIAAPLYQASSGKAFNGITAVSEQESNNEVEFANQVIANSHMTGLRVKPTYQDFIDSLPSVVSAQEEPFGSTSLTMQYFVMKTAREQGIPVLLDGQGGDETLLGYEKYYGSYLATTLRKQGPIAFANALRSSNKNNKKLSLFNAMKYLVGSTIAPVRYMYYCRKHPYLLQRPAYPMHLSEYSQSNWDTFNLQKFEIERTNLPVLLRYEDKNSMAHSIETRLPFLDYRVVEAALSIPGAYKIKDGWSKWILRKGMDQRMPDTITWRKNKFGFEAPEALWQKQHFATMQKAIERSPLLNSIAKPLQLKNNYKTLDARSQWRLYSIALWEKAFGVNS